MGFVSHTGEVRLDRRMSEARRTWGDLRSARGTGLGMVGLRSLGGGGGVGGGELTPAIGFTCHVFEPRRPGRVGACAAREDTWSGAMVSGPRGSEDGRRVSDKRRGLREGLRAVPRREAPPVSLRPACCRASIISRCALGTSEGRMSGLVRRPRLDADLDSSCARRERGVAWSAMASAELSLRRLADALEST